MVTIVYAERWGKIVSLGIWPMEETEVVAFELAHLRELNKGSGWLFASKMLTTGYHRIELVSSTLPECKLCAKNDIRLHSESPEPAPCAGHHPNGTLAPASPPMRDYSIYKGEDGFYRLWNKVWEEEDAKTPVNGKQKKENLEPPAVIREGDIWRKRLRNKTDLKPKKLFVL